MYRFLLKKVTLKWKRLLGFFFIKPLIYIINGLQSRHFYIYVCAYLYPTKKTFPELFPVTARKVLYPTWNRKWVGNFIVAVLSSQRNFDLLKISGPSNSKRENYVYKVQLFWEGHKTLRNLPHGFDICLQSMKNYKEDCANFCGLLRKVEL